MKMQVAGTKSLLAELLNIGEKVPDNARKVMHRNADKIIEEAVLNAPVDKHNLEQAIRKRISYQSTFRKRLKIDIEVGGIVNGVNVDEYAMQIHENYGSMNPGKGTIAKRDANPGRFIGEKFLERAVEAVEGKLRPSLIQAVLRGINGKSI
ncbi:hypothetical protein [Methylorubrum extorquens]|uniref:hypothetical protein n=1 Tax=Methylorubrum extorquens TaxID=408 RepID=UPI00209DB419|nr:hypothetical protein [Methylorubrum extorquens]MCP1540061.1 HK97 gp10 family phage protein [Methylorubrum extorquens]